MPFFMCLCVFFLLRMDRTQPVSCCNNRKWTSSMRRANTITKPFSRGSGHLPLVSENHHTLYTFLLSSRRWWNFHEMCSPENCSDAKLLADYWRIFSDKRALLSFKPGSADANSWAHGRLVVSPSFSFLRVQMFWNPPINAFSLLHSSFIEKSGILQYGAYIQIWQLRFFA